jgi:hypothetical protein
MLFLIQFSYLGKDMTFDEWWASNVWEPYFIKWQETGGRIYFEL